MPYYNPHPLTLPRRRRDNKLPITIHIPLAHRVVQLQRAPLLPVIHIVLEDQRRQQNRDLAARQIAPGACGQQINRRETRDSMQDSPYAAAWPARKAHERARQFRVVEPALRLERVRRHEHGRVVVEDQRRHGVAKVWRDHVFTAAVRVLVRHGFRRLAPLPAHHSRVHPDRFLDDGVEVGQPIKLREGDDVVGVRDCGREFGFGEREDGGVGQEFEDGGAEGVCWDRMLDARLLELLPAYLSFLRRRRLPAESRSRGGNRSSPHRGANCSTLLRKWCS